MDDTSVLGLQRTIYTLKSKIESLEEHIVTLGNRNRILEEENIRLLVAQKEETPVEMRDLEDAKYNTVGLTKKEHRLLMALVREPKGLTKTAAMYYLYPGSDKAYEQDCKIIDVYLCKLRKKLRDTYDFPQSCITTMHGKGYIIDPDCRPALEARIGWGGEG